MPSTGHYVVTGYVNRLGRRDTLSKKMSKSRAEAFKRSLTAELKTATPKYKWAKALKIEPR